jgi:hypothetical protein
VAAELPAPARDFKETLAAWVAESVLQWAVRGVAPREVGPQAVEHKPLTTFTEVPQAEGRAEQPRPHREAQALAEVQHREREAPQARVLQRPERLAWPAQRQLEAQPKPSKARARKRRDDYIQESILKKTS